MIYMMKLAQSTLMTKSVLFKHFKEWLLVNHPEIEYFFGTNITQRKTIQARHPNTVKLYLTKIRSVFEEIGNIEINSRLFNKRIKTPMAEEETQNHSPKNK